MLAGGVVRPHGAVTLSHPYFYFFYDIAQFTYVLTLCTLKWLSLAYLATMWTSGCQGKAVELECRAAGDDPISIAWRREGAGLEAEPGRSSVTVIRELQHVTSRSLHQALSSL